MSGTPWPGLRPAWVEVDLEAIAGNVRTLAAEVAPARLLAVVKADAYGHGAIRWRGRRSGPGGPGSGWRLVEEALELRRAGISTPLRAVGPRQPRPTPAADRIAVTVCTQAEVLAFGMAGRRAGRPMAVHLKVDTGMHRQGCDPAELPALVAAATAEPGLEVEGLWSHFAVADEAAKTATTDTQLARFRDALAAAAAAGRPATPGQQRRSHRAQTPASTWSGRGSRSTGLAPARSWPTRSGPPAAARPCGRPCRPCARSRPGSGSPTGTAGRRRAGPASPPPGRVRRRTAPWPLGPDPGPPRRRPHQSVP